jgi:hypothetical protein
MTTEFEFCDRCQTESTDDTAGGFKQGMFGREFKGRLRACPDCGSWVATLWSQFLYFPLTPLGTYRMKMGKVGFGGSFRFWSRKLPALDRTQVKSTRLWGSIGALVVMAGAAVLIALFGCAPQGARGGRQYLSQVHSCAVTIDREPRQMVMRMIETVVAVDRTAPRDLGSR